MIGFTKLTHSNDSSEKAAPTRERTALKDELVTIAVMVAILALAFGVKLWVYLPWPRS